MESKYFLVPRIIFLVLSIIAFSFVAGAIIVKYVFDPITGEITETFLFSMMEYPTLFSILVVMNFVFNVWFKSLDELIILALGIFSAILGAVFVIVDLSWEGHISLETWHTTILIFMGLNAIFNAIATILRLKS